MCVALLVISSAPDLESSSLSYVHNLYKLCMAVLRSDKLRLWCRAWLCPALVILNSAHAAAGNKDILQAQDCTTGTLLGCGGSCCQLQAGLLLLRMRCQAVMCSITHHDVIPCVIASVCRFWASWPFRLRLLYRNSIRHGCRVYIYNKN